MSKIDKFAESLGEKLIKHRWLVILLTLITVVITTSGAQFLGFDTNYRVFFGKDNEQLKTFEDLQAVYTKTDNVLFVVKPNEGEVFKPNVLNAIKELTEKSWKLPHSTRVDSLTNYQHTYAEGDDLTVVDLVEKDPDELTQKDLDWIREVTLSEPTLKRRLISPSGETTAVNITFNFTEKDPFEVPKTAAAAKELLEEVSAKYPDIKMVATGIVMMNSAFSEASQNDMATLIPIMYLILLVTMALFLRSFFSMFATFFVIAFSAMTAMGLAGWAGIMLTPPSASAPTIILTLAIADSIHIIVSMIKEMQNGRSKNEAIIESVRINLKPIFLTSLTTSIGFMTLNFSDAPPFHDLGNITAVGVMAAFLYSIIFLPSLLSLLPAASSTKKSPSNLMDKFAELVIAHRGKFLICSTTVVLLCAAFIPKLQANDQFVQYFSHDISFRGDTEFAMENLSGIYLAEYSLSSGEDQGVSRPDYLENLEKYANWLREQPEVDHVYSMADIFKRLNKNMHGDDENWYKIPEARDMAAQYLLLYEFSLPYGLDLNDRIDIDKNSTRLTVTLKDISTREMRDFKERSEKWLKDNTPKSMHAEATSPNIMFAYISERNINSMLEGNIIALLLISFCIMVALRNLKLGIVSLVPNLVPVIMGFGIWGAFIEEVNMAVAVVFAISLGIVVDDTVHFLSKYDRARNEKNLGARDAVRYAFRTVGPALVITTFILIAGFSVLLFSNFQMNSTMGAFTALVIGSALAADFLLLPPLLMYIDKKKGSK